MRARSGLLSLVCIVGLIVAGCSSEVAGSPEGAANAVSITSSSGDAASGSEDTDAENTQSLDPSDTADDSSDSDLTFPTDTMPSGLAGLTDLTDIPGFSSGCLAAAGIAMGFGMLMLAPVLGGTEVSADDVDEAFAHLSDVPPELKDVVDVLHKAAVAATGQPLAKATDILDSPEVTKAMDKLSAYTDANCGG